MTTKTKEIVNMLEMLPEAEQDFALEVMKKLIIAWDADFTKLTDEEEQILLLAKNQMKNGEYLSDNEIDWDNLDKLNLD